MSLRALRLKEDFDKTLDRFEAWWERRLLDRPPVSLHVKNPHPRVVPVPPPSADLRERWMDVSYNVDRAIAALQAGIYPGDSFPAWHPNIGPELTGTLFGCDLEFSERTSWSIPIVHDIEDWHKVLETEPDFDNAYWRTIEQMTDLAIGRCHERFIVALPDLHGNYDILASLREPEALCLDMVDDPELMRRVGRHVADGFVAAFQRIQKRVLDAGFPSTTWTRYLHDGPAYVPSCDFWIMVGPEPAREMILPDIRREIEPLERSIFHLDGPQALRHLDLLLEIDELDAVQWVYGAGGGRAGDWIEVYRRIQDAGKSMQVIARDPEDALTVFRALKPEGVWLDVDEAFDTRREAEDFLARIEALTHA